MGFMDWFNNTFTQPIARTIADLVLTETGRATARVRDYRLGRQPAQLKVKTGQYDDNLIVNFTGLVLDRAVSQMVGGGVEFRFEEAEAAPEAEEDTPVEGERPKGQMTALPQEEYIDAVWDANHKEILLHRAVLAAAENGTGYIFINDPTIRTDDGGWVMGAAADSEGNDYPRLVLLDPAFVTMQTPPEDFEVVTKYIIQYKFIGLDGKEAMRRRTVEHDYETDKWTITDEENSFATGNKWVVVNVMDWPYDFGPIVHWQNLPSIDSPYGEPDITPDLIDLQDKLNGDVSFLSKALRLGAHPLRYGTAMGEWKEIQSGPDKIISLPEGSAIVQLPPAVDWAGGLAFFKMLRAAFFDITRTVDIDSLQDKLGALTNFALKVLYQDNMSKIDTKRMLLGDALAEINRRVQLMAGMDALESEVVWGSFLPVNPVETLTTLQSALDLGILSKQTAYETARAALGLQGDWEDEQERIEEEKAAASNVGALLLRGFNAGQGGGLPGFTPAGAQTGQTGQNNGQAAPPAQNVQP